MSHLIKLLEWKSHAIRLGLFAFTTIYLVLALLLKINQENSLASSKQQLNQLRSQYSAASNAKNILDAQMPSYTQLQNKGLIGLADRLNWIEELDRIAHDIKIPDIQFTLENTRIAQEGETPFYHYEIPIYISEMYLDLSILHEGDLYRLFTELADSSLGVFSIEECEIRKNSGTKKLELTLGLKSKCHLRWFNLADSTLEWSEGYDVSQ